MAEIIQGDTWERSWMLRATQGQSVPSFEGATARLHVRDSAGTLIVEVTGKPPPRGDAGAR